MIILFSVDSTGFQLNPSGTSNISSKNEETPSKPILKGMSSIGSSKNDI